MVSPWIGWLEAIGGKTDEAIIEFSLGAARKFAWEVALTLAPLTPEGCDRAILHFVVRSAAGIGAAM